MKALIQIFLLSFFMAAYSKDDNSISKNPLHADAPVVQSEKTYDVTVIEGVIYAEGLSHETYNSNNSIKIPLKLDVFIPDNNLEKRPAIVLIHGGGFSKGTRTDHNIVNMANYFASRGWVVFSIDYRLQGDEGTVPTEWVQYAKNNLDESFIKRFLSLYPAHRDAKAALRWVFANASSYNIDPDYVTVGGGSAGAIIAITLGVTDAEDYTDELSVSTDPTLSTTNTAQSYKIHTILDFWGSKVAVDALNNVYGYKRFDASNAPILIAHGTEDKVVPFSEAEELKNKYTNTGVNYIYYPLQGYGHGAWNATVNGKRLEKLSFDFIVEQQNLTVE